MRKYISWLLKTCNQDLLLFLKDQNHHLPRFNTTIFNLIFIRNNFTLLSFDGVTNLSGYIFADFLWHFIANSFGLFIRFISTFLANNFFYTFFFKGSRSRVGTYPSGYVLAILEVRKTKVNTSKYCSQCCQLL